MLGYDSFLDNIYENFISGRQSVLHYDGHLYSVICDSINSWFAIDNHNWASYDRMHDIMYRYKGKIWSKNPILIYINGRIKADYPVQKRKNDLIICRRKREPDYDLESLI